MNIADYGSLADLVRAAGDDRDKVAVHFAGTSYTYGDLDRRSAAVAAGLAAAGVRAGDRVVLLARNGIAFLDAFFAVPRLGAILVPINWRLSPTEITFIVGDSDPAAIVADEDLAANLPAKDGAVPRFLIRRRGAEIDIATGSAIETRDTVATLDDVALIVYTSGTTGHPKGAMVTHGNFARHCGLDQPDVARWYGIDHDDICLVALPLFHVGALELALRPLFTGATIVLHREVDPARIIADIEAFGVTMTGLVPAALQMLLDNPASLSADFSSLRKFFYGAAPIPLGILRDGLERLKCDFIQSYGMTEAAGTCSMLAPRDHDDRGAARLKSAGRPLPGMEMRIVDPDGTDVPTGTVGEVVVRGTNVMTGYWQRPVATAEAIDLAGWLRSGDAGYMDADGYLYICDRLKDMICSGGENIYPAEVEAAIHGHPKIAEVSVVGVPHALWGESVHAVVVLHPGQTADAAEVIAWARDRIAAYKAPKQISFAAALPRNAAGKILRRELRAALASQNQKVGHE